MNWGSSGCQLKLPVNSLFLTNAVNERVSRVALLGTKWGRDRKGEQRELISYVDVEKKENAREDTECPGTRSTTFAFLTLSQCSSQKLSVVNLYVRSSSMRNFSLSNNAFCCFVDATYSDGTTSTYCAVHCVTGEWAAVISEYVSTTSFVGQSKSQNNKVAWPPSIAQRIGVEGAKRKEKSVFFSKGQLLFLTFALYVGLTLPSPRTFSKPSLFTPISCRCEVFYLFFTPSDNNKDTESSAFFPLLLGSGTHRQWHASFPCLLYFEWVLVDTCSKLLSLVFVEGSFFLNWHHFATLHFSTHLSCIRPTLYSHSLIVLEHPVYNTFRLDMTIALSQTKQQY